MTEVIENLRGAGVSIYEESDDDESAEQVTYTHETEIDEMYVDDGTLRVNVEVQDSSEIGFVGLEIPLLAGQSYKDFLMSLPDIRIPDE